MEWIAAVFALVCLAQLVALYLTRNRRSVSIRGNIRYAYDKKAHMGYIYLNGRDGPNTQGIRTEEIAPGVFGDFEISSGDLLGLEIFDTRSTK